jgi:hypothetical protein
MKIEVLMRQPDENQELFDRLDIKREKSDDDSYFFTEAYIRDSDVESIFVVDNTEYGKIMQVYCYNQEIPLTCKLDRKAIVLVFS